MRTTLLTVLALTMSTAAVAQQAASSLPGISPGELGSAAALGSVLCGIPPSTIEAMNKKAEQLSPGVTHSPLYLAGVSRGQNALREVRTAQPPDDSELRATKCPEIDVMVKRLAP